MASHAELVGRYGELRRKGIELHGLLARSVCSDALPAIARRFGWLNGRTIMLDSEDQSAVLMDSCIHDYRVNGENAAALNRFAPGQKPAAMTSAPAAAAKNTRNAAGNNP